MEQIIDKTLKQSDTHLQTLPGVSTITAASILGRIVPSKRFSSVDKLAR